MTAIPSEADWGDWRKSDLDVQYAHKIFAGKTNTDVQPDFARAVIERTDELRWMPKKPFQYYILGFKDHVMGPLQELDAGSAASCFLGLIEEKLKGQPDYILPVMKELMPAVSHIAEHQTDYDADIEIFGNFKEQERRIEELYRKQA